MENITVRNYEHDLKRSASLLSVFRHGDNQKDYRTTADSLLILYGIYKKEIFEFSKLDEKVFEFVEEFLVGLNQEIFMLYVKMGTYLEQKKVREYRDLLLSYEKLQQFKSLMLKDIDDKNPKPYSN